MGKLVMDVEQVAREISKKTGFDYDMVLSVLDKETDWMRDNGFIKSRWF